MTSLSSYTISSELPRRPKLVPTLLLALQVLTSASSRRRSGPPTFSAPPPTLLWVIPSQLPIAPFTKCDHQKRESGAGDDREKRA